MTPTFPTAGTPAARRADAWRLPATVRTGVGAIVAILLVLLGSAPALAAASVPSTLIGATSGSSAGTAATPSPTPTDLSGEVTLTLAPGGNGLVGPGAGLSASIILANGTDRFVAERTATLAIGTEALPDRGALAAWLSGDSAADDLAAVTGVTLEGTASGGAATAIARLEADAPALQNRAPGVYPLLARTAEGEDLSARSVIIVPSDAAATTPVAVVVPVTAGPLPEGLLSSDELAALTAADGLLTATLDAVAGTSAILAVDPAIPAAVRVLGSSAPETAVAWLDRLLRLPNERFALQFGDADLTAQLAAGIPAPLQPATLQPYMIPADFADSTASPEPTPSATEGVGPVLPDLPALLDIGATRQAVYWPVTGTADAAAVAALGAAAVDGQSSLTLIPSSSTESSEVAAATPAVQRAGDAAVLVYDSAVSAALRDAAVVPDTLGRGAPLTVATAYLALSGASDPLLVVVDRANDITRVGVRAAIAAATQAPGASPATLDQLLADSPGTVTVVGGQADADRSAAASALVADEGSLSTFSSILDDPAVMLGPERAEILQLLGAGWATDRELWDVALAAHRTGTAATLDAVGILPPTTTNLISSGAGLGFWVRNDLPWPVNVRLSANPDDVRLEVENVTEVRADAASNKRVEVPVQARLGNGEVTIALQLSSPSGVPIGTAQQVDVNVRAELEGVGVVILSVLVGGLIVLGLVRTVLHRRWLRRHPEAASSEADA